MGFYSVTAAALLTFLTLFSCSENRQSAHRVIADKSAATSSPGTWPGFTLRGLGVGNRGISKITEQDFLKFKSWRVNVLRVHLNGPNDESLESLVSLARKYNIRLVFALMELPGVYGTGRNEQFWSSFAIQEQFIDFWRGIAARFKNEGDIIAGYDLLNEPAPTGNDRGDKYPANYPASPNSTRDLKYLYSRTIAAIRAIDPNRTIVVESRCYGQLCWKRPTSLIGSYVFDMSMPVLQESNVVYSVHWYHPDQYTHQGVGQNVRGINYPGTVEYYGYFDSARTRNEIRKIHDFALENNVKIFIGEYSVAAWAPNAAKFLEDVTGSFEAFGFSSSYHHYNEYDGWNLEFGDSTRLKTMRKYWGLNSP